MAQMTRRWFAMQGHPTSPSRPPRLCFCEQHSCSSSLLELEGCAVTKKARDPVDAYDGGLHRESSACHLRHLRIAVWIPPSANAGPSDLSRRSTIGASGLLAECLGDEASLFGLVRRRISLCG